MFCDAIFDREVYPDRPHKLPSKIAAGDAVILGNTHPDAITVWVYHGLEVAKRVDPAVDGPLGSVAPFQGVVPGVAPVGTGLGGVH